MKAVFERVEARVLFALAAPVGIVSTPVNPVAIELTWQNPNATPTEVRIERKKPNGLWMEVASIPSTAAISDRFRDTNLTNGTAVEYRFRTTAAGEAPSTYAYKTESTPKYDAGLRSPVVAPTVPYANGTTRNILSYGATSNNAADDDAIAIKNALAACAVGDTVYIPNGVYHLKTPNISIKSGVALVGESMEGAKLLATYATPDERCFSITKGVSNVVVKRLRFDRSPDTVYVNAIMVGTSGIEDPVASQVELSELHIEGFEKYALNVRNGQNVNIHHNVIANATKTGGGGEGYGVVINYDNASNNWVHHNTIGRDEPGNYQIRHSVLIQYRAHHNLIEHNTTYNNVYDHFDLHGEDEYSNELRYNFSSGSTGGAGFGAGNTGATHVDTGPHNWIHHNEVLNCESGMELLLGSHRQYIEDNNFHDNRDYGIRIYNGGGNDLILMRNTLRRNGTGIYMESSTGSWIEKNIVTGNRGSGLVTRSSVSSYVIINNDFSNNAAAVSRANLDGEYWNNLTTPVVKTLPSGPRVDRAGDTPIPLVVLLFR